MSKGRVSLVALLAGCSLASAAAIAIAWSSFAAKGTVAKSASTTTPAAEIKEVAATTKTSTKSAEPEVVKDLLDEA